MLSYSSSDVCPHGGMCKAHESPEKDHGSQEGGQERGHASQQELLIWAHLARHGWAESQTQCFEAVHIGFWNETWPGGWSLGITNKVTSSVKPEISNFPNTLIKYLSKTAEQSQSAFIHTIASKPGASLSF